MKDSTSTTGLVLTGGGARAAYQVGVLQAVAQIRRESGVAGGNPFPVIAGTSAGAINAAALASRADMFDHAVRHVTGDDCDVGDPHRCERVQLEIEELPAIDGEQTLGNVLGQPPEAGPRPSRQNHCLHS